MENYQFKHVKSYQEHIKGMMNENKKYSEILPHLVVVKFDETEYWSEDIQEKAVKIEGYYLTDINIEYHAGDITGYHSGEFLFNRFENDSEFDEDKLSELEHTDGRDGGESPISTRNVEKFIVYDVNDAIPKNELKEAIESEEDYIEFFEKWKDYVLSNSGVIGEDYIKNKKVN